MEEEAKAVQEAAKATGKAIDASREFGGFIARFIKGPLEQGVGIFEDKLSYMRWERQVRLMERANEFLQERDLGLPSRAVPMKIAIPLMQAALLEDDNYLQDIWARLLVNAADKDSGIHVRRTFISILENLGSLEIQILEKIYSLPSAAPYIQIWTRDLPEKALIEKPGEVRTPLDDVALALANLSRLGCLEPIMTMGSGGTSLASVRQTVLGRKLYEACSTKRG